MYLTSSQKAFNAFKKWVRFDVEEVWVIALNSQMVMLEKDLIFRGTVSQCPAHPREIFRFLIQSNASAFMMAHSHPSGVCKPSNMDRRVTRQISKVGSLVGIPLVDHLVITENNYFSFADHHFFRKVIKESGFTQPLCW